MSSDIAKQTMEEHKKSDQLKASNSNRTETTFNLRNIVMRLHVIKELKVGNKLGVYKDYEKVNNKDVKFIKFEIYKTIILPEGLSRYLYGQDRNAAINIIFDDCNYIVKKSAIVTGPSRQHIIASIGESLKGFDNLMETYKDDEEIKEKLEGVKKRYETLLVETQNENKK